MKKNTILAGFLFLLFAISSFAQTGEKGIYKSAADFVAGKKTHAGKHTKIRLHEVFKRDIIQVKYNDSTYTYHKKNVYGYFDEDGVNYRFFNGEIYPMLNPYEKIILYKKVSGINSKNSSVTETYFFSKDAGSGIFQLTLRNIENTFSDNFIFDELIEIHFKSDNELTEYDYIHKMYKLNRLLELSRQDKLTDKK